MGNEYIRNVVTLIVLSLESITVIALVVARSISILFIKVRSTAVCIQLLFAGIVKFLVGVKRIGRSHNVC